ncbi:transketolase [Candidatus Pacearchaeota archaeon]|nr:transketolase [Candidatus Pacearchaeota archaeon]
MVDVEEIKKLQDIANVSRRDVLKMTSAAGSGHATSCLSCAEIISVLFFHEMNYDIKSASNPNNDEFILSKGHAAPILYSCLFHAGCIKEDLNKLRKLNSDLEGHPTPSPTLKGWIKVATGSLGQGASVGVGMALAGKMQKRKFRTYVLLGDSECSEGSVWEAFQLASYYNLDNLCFVIDVNRLGQRGETMLGYDLRKYYERLKSFGLNVEIADGHNVERIIWALENAKKANKATAILAKTIKGKGVSFIEDKNGWHGKALRKDELEKALKEIPNAKFPKVKINKPEEIKSNKTKNVKTELKKESYKIGAEISTREAYGKALGKLAEMNREIIALDGEVSNSTFAEEVKKIKSEQFIEAFIAEQNMVGMALGLSKKGFNVFASTFAAFLLRAHDQIRMGALSNADFTLCGSHCGVSIGEDGTSQMGLEDIGMFRAIPNSIIFYPSDAVSTEKLVFLASELDGIKYIRTTRPKTKVIYKNNENFELGDFKVLKENNNDKIVFVGAGITVHECLKAQKELKRKKIESAVVDLYCIKPFNSEKFLEFVARHGGKIVIAEDHYLEGGIGEMLCQELKNTGIKIETLAIKEIPHSGKKEELLEKYQIDASAIVNSVKRLVR